MSLHFGRVEEADACGNPDRATRVQRHVFLLKAIARIKGDYIFGGRIPEAEEINGRHFELDF
jgi:hypothetical protein